MIHVVKIGPLEEGPDTTSIYTCVADCALPPHMGAVSETDQAALEEIQDKLGPERQRMIRCEPVLAAAGEALGIEVAPLSRAHRERVAAFACQINVPQLALEMGAGLVVDMLRAAVGAYHVRAGGPLSFELVAPFPSGDWSLFSGAIQDDPDTVVVMGDGLGSLPGGLPRMLGVGFKDAPAYFVDRMAAAFGLPKAVMPFRAQGTVLEQIDVEDMRLLVHVLRVLAGVGEGRAGLLN